MEANGQSYEYVIGTGAMPAGEGPDFCKYCLIDAFNKLDDRPEEMPAEKQ
jgi:hypothetical protein